MYLKILHTPISQSLSYISIFGATGMAIVSMQPWFAWHISLFSIFASIFITAQSLILFSNPNIPQRDTPALLSSILFGFFFCQILINPLNIAIRDIFAYVLPICLTITLTNKERKIFLQWFITLFCIILLVSIVFFIIKRIGISLPYSIIHHPNPFYPPIRNYFFFTEMHDWGFMTRFCSIYTEPGHLGMMCAILLYITRYEFSNWRVIVLLIGLLWSMSLAGYLLGFIGYILYRLTSAKQIHKGLISICIICSTPYIFSTTYYDPTNTDFISTQILRRLQFDSTKGIVGNNRNTKTFNNLYDRYTNTNDYLVGLPQKDYKRITLGTANSSYKNFVLNRGIIATVLMWLTCLIFLYNYPSKIGFGFFILLLFTFIQRPYFIWASQYFTFFCAIPLFFNLQIKRHNTI